MSPSTLELIPWILAVATLIYAGAYALAHRRVGRLERTPWLPYVACAACLAWIVLAWVPGSPLTIVAPRGKLAALLVLAGIPSVVLALAMYGATRSWWVGGSVVVAGVASSAMLMLLIGGVTRAGSLQATLREYVITVGLSTSCWLVVGLCGLRVWVHVTPRRPRSGQCGRCGRCGYSLAGLRGDVCPECGEALGISVPVA